MYKPMLITFIIFASTLCTSNILKQNTIKHVPQECSPKLLSGYISGVSDFERSSMVPSELLSSTCMNLEDSCCLDEEFQAMTSIAAQNLKQVQKGIMQVLEAFKLFKNLNVKTINEIIAMYTPEELKEMDLTAESVTEDLQFLKSEENDIALNLWNSYKLLENYGANLNCTICEASNHTNFSNMDGRMDELKMKFDFNYCYSLFNSPEVISQFEFIKYMKNINTLTMLLGKQYNVNVYDGFRNSYEQVEKADQLRLSCLASVDDYSDDEKCAEMCLEIGSPNGFSLKHMIKPLAQLTVMITDFFGTQSLLKQTTSPSESNESPETSKVTVEETIRVFADEWNVDYILPPNEMEDNKGINLNRMKIDLAYETGWNFYEIRMKDWHAFVGSVSVVKAVVFLAGIFALLF
jgi:hypothetical protein